MAITNTEAIKFSNEHLRPAADRLARCYYRAQELNDLWAAQAGTNAEKLVILADKLKRVATLITNTYRRLWWMDRLWQVGGMSALIPNDAAEVLNDGDGGPDTTRGQVTGQDLRRLKQRAEEFLNHLAYGADGDKHFVTDANVTATLTNDYFDDCAVFAEDSPKDGSAGNANTFANSRCGDLVTEYETTNPAKLTHILTVAVNPLSQAD